VLQKTFVSRHISLLHNRLLDFEKIAIRRTCMFQINEADEAIGLASSWDL
jgi:hypothetical protein